MEPSWISLLPFLIVIPISIWTKQVIPGLFIGLLLGSYLIEPSLIGGIQSFISYIVDNVIALNNIRIIIFLYGFAGLISMIKLAGGIKGFVFLVGKKVKTKRSAMFLTWISTIGTFSDPDFRIVTIAPIMKSLRKRLKMSKQSIGFAIEATSNPVVALIPVATAFVGYMVTTIGNAMEEVGINEAPYIVYIKSIPFNFFSFVIIFIGIYYSFFKKDKADSLETTKATDGKDGEKVLRSGDGHAFKPAFSTEASDELSQINMKNNEVNPNEEQGEEEDMEACELAYEKETPKKPWNLILPVGIFLVLTLFLSWWDGHTKTTGFFDAFIKTDALGVMLESLLIALLLSLIFFMFQGFGVQKLVTHFIKGGNELMSVIVLLALIWGLSAVSEDLGFSEFITNNVQGWIPKMFVAPILFLLGGLISYFIGSSWGTWGMLMPLGIALAAESGANIYLVIGAVFASGTFGAFASPLSDNTVTLCTILDIPVMKYARTKLVPALIAAGITTVLYGAVTFII